MCDPFWIFPLISIRDYSQIVAVSHSVRRHVAEKTDIKAVRFITSYLLPPPKKAVLAFLGVPLQYGEKPEPATEIIRKAEVDVSGVADWALALISFADSARGPRPFCLVRRCRERVGIQCIQLVAIY